MLCSNPKLDSHRFKDIIDEAIAAGRHLFLAYIMCTKTHSSSDLFVRYETIVFLCAGEVKSTKAYKKWAKEISEMEPPTNPQKTRRK